MIAQIDVAMGGRAAEELFLGNDEITVIFYYVNKYIFINIFIKFNRLVAATI